MKDNFVALEMQNVKPTNLRIWLVRSFQWESSDLKKTNAILTI